MPNLIARVLARHAASTMADAVVRRFLAADTSPTQEGAKRMFERYKDEHPQTRKSPADFYEKPEGSEGGKKEEAKGGKPKERKPLFNADDMKGLSDSVKQKETDPDKLFEAAKVAHEQQLDMLDRDSGLDKAIGAKVVRGDKGDKGSIDYDKPGPVILIGPPKKRDRSKEKVDADFGGDWSRLGDVVRASVAVDSYDQLEDVMGKLRKSGLKLARKPKDRFAKPTEAGYRDVLISVEYPNGHVGELQLHLKPILKAKDEGHKFYEEVRSIEAKAKKEGRETLTDEEQAEVEKANKAMKDLYDKAWQKATGEGPDRTKNARWWVRMAADTKYYEFKDLPAFWVTKKFPKVVRPKGEETEYNLEEFFREARPISAKDFETLKKSQNKTDK